MFLVVFDDIVCYGLQACLVVGILWFFYDDLLDGYAPFQPQSEESHEEVTVQVDVEDHGVFVGLVCEEDGSRYEHDGREAFCEPYGPCSEACHSESCIVEEEVYDVDDDGDDDWHSESSLAYDGSEWCSDEEEYEAEQ